MPIQLGDKMLIPGTVLAPGPVQEEPRLLIREVPRWGVLGLELIASQVGAAGWTTELLLHGNFADHAALKVMLNRIRSFAGTSGTVDVQTPAIPHNEFGNSFFLGPRVLGGEGNGPVLDHAGTLDGGWWQIIQLSWLQTYPDGGT